MSRRVGPKGQVVIDKEIRDQLGVQPGSIAIQKLVGDHVEIRFAPPPPAVTLHKRSLLGILGTEGESVPPKDWRRARGRAWAGAAKVEEQTWRASRTKADMKAGRNGAPR